MFVPWKAICFSKLDMTNPHVAMWEILDILFSLSKVLLSFRLIFLIFQSNPSKVGATSKGPPICPELIDCTIPIENLLPSITSGSSSLGLSNFIRSQNIRTIGNLCVLSTSQIEALPIRAPKVRVVKAALRKYVNMQKKGDKSKSMQNVLANGRNSLIGFPLYVIKLLFD